MDIKQLLTLFLSHKHTGAYPDAAVIPQLRSTTIFIDNNRSFFYLKSSDGKLWRLGVDNDGALKTDPA